MQEGSSRARAAFALAALLFGLALARSRPAPADCPAPGELAAERGHTRVLACRAEPTGLPPRGPARLLAGLRIDPNTADAATLDALPGIGPGRAAAIVAERGRGRFERVEELARVPGIGPRTLAALAGWIGVADAPPPRALGPSRPDPVGCAGDCGAPPRKGDS